MSVRLFSVLLVIVFSIGSGSCASNSVRINYPASMSSAGKRDLLQFLHGKRRVAIILAKDKEDFKGQSGFANYADAVESAVAAALSDEGYFTIVDLANRKERLREIAHSESGLTDASLRLGRELTLDFLLVLRTTAAPRTECKIEKELNTAHPVGSFVGAFAVKAEPGQTLDSFDRTWNSAINSLIGQRDTGIRYLTLFIEGKLINVETGSTLVESVSAPYRHPNQPGSSDCPSELQALDGAIRTAGIALAHQLSPRLGSMEVNLLDDVSDVL
ncbi:MAG: hypothetical protein KDK33_19180, partial [Leptospiraceae bacterium]|nr:hypothetical protein [Leptospiraceae bacterium]